MNTQSYEVLNGARFPIKMWTRGVQVEDAARQQLLDLASMPFVHKHVAVMPDVHWGMGAAIGSVVATRGAIIPAAVGVDIGCGMVALQTSLTASDLPDNLCALRAAIEKRIPHGRTNSGGHEDKGAWREPRRLPRHLVAGLRLLTEKHPILLQASQRAYRHVGTLGTGNHFVEVCLDETQRVWLMLHSGSRGIGNTIGTYFISLAKKEMERWFIHLPSVDLAYLAEGSPLFDDYVQAVGWAQDYALHNRTVMLQAAVEALRTIRPFTTQETAINCHHNYVQKENHFGANVWLTRKGAVRARTGDLGIIPGSMGAMSFIVRGLGNPESFTSCSHGAGRSMSRGAARKRFTVAEHEAATLGVECRKDADVIDETPGAYKDILSVMKAQADLVEVVHTLKQVVCVKG